VEPLCHHLLEALRLLPSVRWFDDSAANKRDAVTIYEHFAFCFNTTLSDLAAHFGKIRDEVVNGQISLIEGVTKRILDYIHPSEEADLTTHHMNGGDNRQDDRRHESLEANGLI